MTKQEFDLKYCGQNGEKVAVHCDTEEKAKAFLKLAKSVGYKWSNGEDLDKNNGWKNYGDDLCFSMAFLGFMMGGVEIHKLEGYKIIPFELDEPKEAFKVGDVVYVSEYGRDSQTYIIVGFENMAIIKNSRGGQKLEALSNLTKQKPLKEITEKELADMGYVLKK